MTGGRDISLFSGYDQKENRTTNYALLLLKLLYEENPSYLDEALGDITGGATAEGVVGIQFLQQQRRAASVPDAVITQVPFTLFVETKNFDWFHDDQLEAHLRARDEEPGLKVLLALSNFEPSETRFERIEQVCQDEYEGRVAFAAVSFEVFVRALRREGLPKRLLDTIDEFERYLDEQDLLPRWRSRLDVCSCTRTLSDQEEHGVYICPATGGHYSHQRSRFFGAYHDKGVRYLADIRAVVDVPLDPSDTPSVYYSNTDEPPEGLYQEAAEKVEAARPHRDYPARVFLLGPLHPTHFRKDSKGGMMGSKQYFDVERLSPTGAEDLAAKLSGVTWSSLS